MAYCSNCGIELNDGAKYCPNCGTSVGGNDRNTPKIKNNNPNQKERLSTWAKIALGVAGFVAFTGVCGGFADGMWVAALLSLCALGAVCAVFMGIIEKKYAWTTAVCAFLVVTMAIGLSAPDENGNSNSSSTTTSKQQTGEKETRQETKKEDSIVGTYEITDKTGCTIHITLNEDKTATITGVRGEGVTYYCTWADNTFVNAGFEISFSDQKPYLVYDGGADTNKYSSIYLNDGWLYSDYNKSKAKNPQWRLKATKIR